jgi:hypothetical protein
MTRRNVTVTGETRQHDTHSPPGELVVYLLQQTCFQRITPGAESLGGCGLKPVPQTGDQPLIAV